MQHSLKFGAAAMVAVFGGGSFYLGAAETPVFAQASTNGSTGQSATTGATTGGATGRPQRRVSRPRASGNAVPDVRGGGGGRPGTTTIADPIPLTAGECTALGGDIVRSSNESCRYSDGSRGDVCITRRDELQNGIIVSQVHNYCINQRQ